MNKNKILNIVLYSLILVLVVFLILIGINFYQGKVRDNTYIITLLGLDEMTLYEGDMYTELGFNASDMYGNDKTSLVKISGNVDSNVIGKYTITYSINSFFKKNEVVRIINVVENPLKDVTFSLNGGNVNLNLYDEYQEAGFVCFDKNNVDCSSNVIVQGNVLTNKIGNYTTTYILRIGNKEKVLTRNVLITGPSYEYSLDKEEKVNTDVFVKFQSNISNFDYIVNPNGENVYSDIVNYRVSKNGNYRFVIYDKNGVSEEVNVTVSNIDKELPVGSCKAIVNGNTTSYNVVASDNGNIVKYVHKNYPDKIHNTSNFVVNSRIDDGSVLVYDEASNYTEILCDTNYAPILANGSSFYSYNSETLKYWIEKPKSDYNIIHIWMEDAYNQLKTALSNPFGSLSSPSNILKTEINRMGYANKGMVALNGSAFVSEEFDQSFYHTIPAWKNTAVTPIVIHDGKVIRNFTDQILPGNQYLTYGLAKDGKLKYYTFYSTSNIASNKQTSQNIIDSGIKYTFGFRPVLVSSSKRIVSDGYDGYKRQAIGQIDKNNFVIISTDGVSLNEIADKMVALGCHTGLNLDGGGSVNLFYKGNTSQYTTIWATGRAVADILYFVEK